MSARATVALTAAILTSSCAAAPLLKLPAGPGVPSPDAATTLAQATVTCRAIRTFTAEVGVSGTIGGKKIRRSRLLAGVAAPASAYLDAPAPFGASVFIFAAVDDQATLLLPRDRRVLSGGRPAEVLEAAAGVPLGPSALRETLTGCTSNSAGDGSDIGETWRVIRGSSERYLSRNRPADPWRLVAVVHRESGQPEWRAEFRDFANDVPRTIRIASVDPKGFDLTLALSQVEINVPLEGDVFHPRVPSDYAPLTLDDLRAAGPMAEAGSGRR
jgi:hypothetical protein